MSATVERPKRSTEQLLSGAIVIAVGLVYGVSAFFNGFFALSGWGRVALGLLAVLFGLMVARTRVPGRAALIALGALGGLWLWSYASTLWAESEGSALVGANRWMLYTAAFAVLILLVRDDRRGRLLLGAATAGLLIVAGYVVVRLLAGGADDMFVGVRLAEPLGYVNGQASCFLMGIWPLLAVAETTRSRLASAAALGGAALLGCLVLLCQTRAALPATAITALLLVLLLPGRGRRLWMLILLALAIGAGTQWLVIPASDLTPKGVPTDGALQAAALAALAIGLAAALIWAIADRAAAAVPEGFAGGRARLSTALLVGVVGLGVIGGVAKVGNPIDKADQEWKSFTDPVAASKETSTRLLTGGGQRYDYWRVALNEFADHPLDGAGAGNYPADYYRTRKTQEPGRQPHSLIFQTMGELGLVGLVLLILFVGSVLTALWRRARHGTLPAHRTVPIAAGGIFLVWLLHTSLDWLHIIPGLTGVALCAAAALFAPPQAKPPAPRTQRNLFLAIAACGLALIFAAVSVNRILLAENARAAGQGALASNPGLALEKAKTAIDLNPDLVEAYYLRAAAYARFNQFDNARAALGEAIRREPHNYLPYVLLGDLWVRRETRPPVGKDPCKTQPNSNFPRALRYYAQAHELSPVDSLITYYASQPCRLVPPG